MNELPQRTLDQEFEDTEAIDEDIDHLYQRFIAPIDAIRSIADGGTDIREIKVDPVNLLESRVHAFYRLLGLPVVAKNGNHYNPGFNPSPKENINRTSIDEAIDQNILNLSNLREQYHRSTSQLFSAQGLEATLFGLVMQQIKPFNMLDTNKTKAIDGRENILEELKTALPNLSQDVEKAKSSFGKIMGFGLNSASHILKPFMVNPFIDMNVMPVGNKICVPFLPNISSTKISSNPDIFLLRPGIEFIIRARLKDNAPDVLFLNNVTKIITQNKSPGTNSDISLLRSTIEALVDENDLSQYNVTEIFDSFTTIQATVVKQLIKTLKVVIRELHRAVLEIEKVKKKITFLPIPNKKGFDKGGTLRDSQPLTKLEKDIVALSIKRLNAERDIEVERNLGNFATSEFISLEKVDLYSQQIDEYQQLKKDIGESGLRALKTIEIITGEGSGLGLVDVLAIYTALWSIDIEDLLGILDQDSFERLYSNVELRASSVLDRRNNGGKSVNDSLTALEKKTSNILSFADLLYSRTFVSSIENEGGDPT